MLKSGIGICFAIISLFARDFFISFDLTSKNNKLTSFHFYCSKAMTDSCRKGKFLFSIDTDELKVEKVCKKESSKIVDNLMRYKSIIYSNDKLSNFSIKSREKLTFPPRRFDIIIKNYKAYFYLKERD